MALNIVNNVSSLQAQDALTQSTNSLDSSLQKLSTGLKINKGADGPAALVISEQQRAQISGLQTAINNVNNAVSVVQTGEGALNEISSLLDTIRGLAVDSANTGVDDSTALAANQSEISNALNTINNIATNTQFGTTKLLDGSLQAQATLDSGSTGDETVSVSGAVPTGSYGFNITSAATAATVVAGAAYTAPTAGDGENLSINGVSINISSADTTADDAAATINAYTAQTGVVAVNNAGTLQLQSTSFGTGHTISVTSDDSTDGTGFFNPASNVDGTDIQGTIDGVAASGVGNVLTSNSGATAGLSLTVNPSATNANTTFANSGTVTVDASKGLVFQIGADAGQTATFSIASVLAKDLGVNGSNNLGTIDVTQTGAAAGIIQTVDQAISQVATLRGQLGAFQSNTLGATINNLQTTLENTTQAESNIRDTDFAAETSNYTQESVLVQAGTSVLQNANQTTQLALSLIQHLG
jgi:flagellin